MNDDHYAMHPDAGGSQAVGPMFPSGRCRNCGHHHTSHQQNNGVCAVRSKRVSVMCPCEGYQPMQEDSDARLDDLPRRAPGGAADPGLARLGTATTLAELNEELKIVAQKLAELNETFRQNVQVWERVAQNLRLLTAYTVPPTLYPQMVDATGPNTGDLELPANMEEDGPGADRDASDDERDGGLGSGKWLESD